MSSTRTQRQLCAATPISSFVFASEKKKYDHYPKRAILANIIITFLALKLTLFSKESFI